MTTEFDCIYVMIIVHFLGFFAMNIWNYLLILKCKSTEQALRMTMVMNAIVSIALILVFSVLTSNPTIVAQVLN